MSVTRKIGRWLQVHAPEYSDELVISGKPGQYVSVPLEDVEALCEVMRQLAATPHEVPSMMPTPPERHR